MENSAEVIIIGGGPAGLSCALVLGRCRRKVLIFDTGQQRNRVSRKMHGFITRDGENPMVFLNKAKKELSSNYGIRVHKHEIVKAERTRHGFSLRTARGEYFFCKKLLLATGLKDHLPPLKNAAKYFGSGLFHCPYCDGWEYRDRPWLIYAERSAAALEVCLRFKDWTSDITLLAAHVHGLKQADRSKLLRNGIRICDTPVKELKGRHGRLHSVRLSDNSLLKAEALFFSTGHSLQNDLAAQLGCRLKKDGSICINRLQMADVPGLYVAGDLAKDMQLVVIAAAEGAKAAVAINAALNKELRI